MTSAQTFESSLNELEANWKATPHRALGGGASERVAAESSTGSGRSGSAVGVKDGRRKRVYSSCEMCISKYLRYRIAFSRVRWKLRHVKFYREKAQSQYHSTISELELCSYARSIQCDKKWPCAPCTMRDLTCVWIRAEPKYLHFVLLFCTLAEEIVWIR